MSAGNGDAFVGRKDARTVQFSFKDFITHSCIVISETADRTHRSDAAHQCGSGKIRNHFIGDTGGDGVAEKKLYQLCIVPLFLRRLAGAGQMDMHVDQSRHQILSFQIELLVSVNMRFLINDILNDSVIDQNCFA